MNSTSAQLSRKPLTTSARLAAATVVTAAVAVLGGGCAGQSGALPCSTAGLNALSASRAGSLIVSITRTSVETASWGFRELARVLPLAASAGLELHVIYTEDGDDLSPAGGDGGPPQVLLADAPRFGAFQVRGRPQPPVDPNSLQARLYCERFASWRHHAMRALRAISARRARIVELWAGRTAGTLISIAGRPIPDASGAEAGVEIDANASILTVAQVAQAARRPVILLLGDLPALRPPSLTFHLAVRVVAVVRSGPPRQILRDESAWKHWTRRCGGTFSALSANDGPAAIARALDEPGG
jgi:hypothetical protein